MDARGPSDGWRSAQRSLVEHLANGLVAPQSLIPWCRNGSFASRPDYDVRMEICRAMPVKNATVCVFLKPLSITSNAVI